MILGNDFVYALVIGWPPKDYLILGSVGSKISGTKVSLVGPKMPLKLNFSQTPTGNKTEGCF